MKTKPANLLPKTVGDIANGGVYRQAVRCGKRNCHCAVGPPHEGYFYFIYRIGGRQKKTYVPKKQVTTINRLIDRARKERRHERLTRQNCRSLLSNLRSRLREFDPIVRDLAEALKQDA